MGRSSVATDRAAVLVMDVVVAGSRANALVLHAPALPKRVLPGVRPHVIVDVEDRTGSAGGEVRKPQVLARHSEKELLRAPFLREAAQHAPRPGRRWRSVGEQQRRSARGRLTTHSLHALLAEGERHRNGIQRDAQRGFLHPVTAGGECSLVQARTPHHRHQQPCSKVLDRRCTLQPVGELGLLHFLLDYGRRNRLYRELRRRRLLRGCVWRLAGHAHCRRRLEPGRALRRLGVRLREHELVLVLRHGRRGKLLLFYLPGLGRYGRPCCGPRDFRADALRAPPKCWRLRRRASPGVAAVPGLPSQRTCTFHGLRAISPRNHGDPLRSSQPREALRRWSHARRPARTQIKCMTSGITPISGTRKKPPDRDGGSNVRQLYISPKGWG